MIPSIPDLADYGLSPETGFLPASAPLARLTDPYYEPWERVMDSYNGYLLAGRLREVVHALPELSTEYLHNVRDLRRAFVVLCFIAHGYVWGGAQPMERLPRQVAVPWVQVANALEVRPVVCHAAVCLWNYKPLFFDEPLDLENLATFHTFSGAMDESWFYLITTAIEARGGPCMPLLLDAMQAAREDDKERFVDNLRTLAVQLDGLNDALARMYEKCDPYVFYWKVRPYLAGWNNMAEAGLPNGVIYEGCDEENHYRKYAGGSAAQSALIHALDIALGVEHRPTGEKKDTPRQPSPPGQAPPPKHNFIHEMRNYMPGPHRRFLAHLSTVANIRPYVQQHSQSHPEVAQAYDACLAMLRSFRDKHIQIVSRYIIIQAKGQNQSPPKATQTTGLAKTQSADKKEFRGTGGTSLIPFLKQARDETGEVLVGGWKDKVDLSMEQPKPFKLAALARADQKAHIADFTQTKPQPPSNGVIGKRRPSFGMAGHWDYSGEGGGLCQF
ncbi:Indoleamine 2,3-dioxygenase [Saitoella coloradoensis]